MKTNIKGSLVIAIVSLFATLAQTTAAQSTGVPARQLNAAFAEQRAAILKIPERNRRLLSAGMQNFLALLEVHSTLPESGIPGMLASAIVSNPSQDTQSVMTGFVQSETSTARCGNQVVIGFNDSNSVIESAMGSGGLSFNGYAVSTNGGTSYTDKKFLNPGPANFFLLGDPVVRCASSTIFYQSSLLEDSSGNSDVSVSISTNGGVTYGSPVVAASKSSSTHNLDKDWMAIDPSNSNNIYVTYTDFDSSGTCGPFFRHGIELVKSNNGGATWSAPVKVFDACNGLTFFQASQVVVGSTGIVYLVALKYDESVSSGSDESFVTATSTDGGLTFTAGGSIPVNCVGAGYPFGAAFTCIARLQGGFNNHEFPSLAVNRTNGTLYVAWDDGTNKVSDSWNAPNPGFYNYGDIEITKSTDGGVTWSAPVKVNQNTNEPLSNGRGLDQFQPGAAVDKTGRVEVCYYDRRLDGTMPFPKQNLLFARFCSQSSDGGTTWADTEITGNSTPIHANDLFVVTNYLGDYDEVAADFTLVNSGFVGGFEVISTRGDPDVKSEKIP